MITPSIKKALRVLLIPGGLLITAVAWSLIRSPMLPRTVTFLGLTNDIANPRLGAFKRMSPSYDQQWLSAGTNVALFTIRNPEGYPVEVLRSCTLYFKGGPRDGYYLPLLNAPVLPPKVYPNDSPVPAYLNFYLRPHETTTVAVPLLAYPGRWKTEFTYYRVGPRPRSLFRSTRRSYNYMSFRADSVWLVPWQ